jgi:hypothetical protein
MCRFCKHLAVTRKGILADYRRLSERCNGMKRYHLFSTMSEKVPPVFTKSRSTNLLGREILLQKLRKWINVYKAGLRMVSEIRRKQPNAYVG